MFLLILFHYVRATREIKGINENRYSLYRYQHMLSRFVCRLREYASDAKASSLRFYFLLIVNDWDKTLRGINIAQSLQVCKRVLCDIHWLTFMV